MSELQIYTLTGLSIYFSILVLMGIWDSKKSDHEGFVIGNRNIGLIPTISSVTASFRDGAGIVFWIGASLTIGYAGLWVFLFATTSLYFFSIYAIRIRAISNENNYITIGEVIKNQLGKVTEKVVSIIILTFALLAIMIQLYVSGNIFSKLVDLPEIYGITAIGIIVTLYLFFGGYGTVVKTDTFQFFIIIGLCLVPFFIKPETVKVLDFSSFYTTDIKTIIGLSLIGFFLPLSNADTWQRVFSAKSDNVIRVGFPASGLFLIIMTSTLIIIGMGIHNIFPETPAGELFFALYQTDIENLEVPTTVLAFLAVGIMAITMSTLDTMSYLFTSTLSKNFLPTRIHNTRTRYINFSRIVFIIIISLMCIAALTIQDIMTTIISVITFITILAPVYMITAMGLVRKSERLDILISLSTIASVITYGVLFHLGIMGDLLLSNIPALLSTFLCIVCVIADKRLFKKEA